jgi:O-antigen/teichoic acid export membrane protein
MYFLRFGSPMYMAPSNSPFFHLLMLMLRFLNVIFTYGMETSYFRFIQRPEYKQDVYSTSFLSIFLTTLVFSAAMMYYAPQIAYLWRVPAHPEYITWFAWIIGLDTLSAIPFARLRQQGRPVKYAAIKLTNIVVNVAASLLFYTYCSITAGKRPQQFFAGGV